MGRSPENKIMDETMKKCQYHKHNRQTHSSE